MIKMDDESREFQKEIARTQTWSSAIITVDEVSFGIGASMWVTAYTIIGTASTLKEEAPFLLNLVNFFNMLGQFFVYIGFVAIMMGFLIPMYLLRSKSKKDKINSNTCFCGNALPCPIHENKSSPI